MSGEDSRDHVASHDGDRQTSGVDPTVKSPSECDDDVRDPAEDRFVRLPPVEPGRYAVEGEIGRGGLGRILRARDAVLDRPVALKELLHSDEESSKRFLREALITARLEHPGIVPVHNAGRWPTGEPFYAMKLVSGRSLDLVIRDASTLDARLSLVPHVLAVSQAVAYAHEQRIIHRDIKPANVIVGNFGETILIDWGLTKDLNAPSEPRPRSAIPSQGADGQTLVGTILGTPAYMAPEQARGDPVDERADVYALGALLYHVLSGAPPYSAATSDAILEKVLLDAPRPLEERDPAIPSDLLAIVAKSMARDPDHRYRDASEMALDLKLFQTGQLVGARRYSQTEIFARWLWRNRALALVVGAALSVVTIGGAISIQKILAERDRARSALIVAEASKKAETVRADDLVIVQARSLVERDPTAALAWLKRLSPDSTRWASARMVALDARLRGVADIVDPVQGRIRALACSPDGRSLAAAGDDGTVAWWPVEGGAGHRVARANIRRVHFASNGAFVIAAGNDGAWVFSASTGDPLFEVVPKIVQGADYGQVAIAQNGLWLAFGAGGFTVWDLEKKERRDSGDDAFYQVALSASGRYLGAAASTHTLQVLDLPGGRPPLVLESRPYEVRQLAFSENEELLVATGRELGVWTVPQGERIRLEGHEGAVWQAAVSPDGRRLVSCGFDRTLRLWRLPGGEGRVLARDVLTNGIAFAPDGVHVAYAVQENLFVLDTDRTERRVFRGHEANITDFAFAPNGRDLVSASLDGRVRIWDLTESGVHRFQAEAGDAAGFTLSRLGWIAIPGPEQVLRLRSLDGTTTRELGALEGGVDSVVFARDGRSVAAASTGGSVTVFDLESGASKVLLGRKGLVHVRTLEPEQRLVLGIADDGSVIVWRLDSGERRELCSGSARLALAAVSESARYVAGALPDENSVFGRAGPDVSLCDTATGALRKLSGRGASVRSLALAHRAPRLAVGADDGSIRIWDLERNEVAIELRSHAEAVLSLSFSSDDGKVASGGADDEVHVLSLKDRSSVSLKGASADVIGVAFAPDGDLLAAASADGIARVYDLTTAEARTLHGAAGVERVAFSPDGRFVVAASSGGRIQAFPDEIPKSGEGIRTWIAEKTRAEIGPGGAVSGIRVAGPPAPGRAELGKDRADGRP